MRTSRSWPLVGGLDLVSSPLTIDPSRIFSGVNYLPTESGYARVGGIERYDGRPAPSEARYWLVKATASTASNAHTLAVDDEVTGASSGATATVIRVIDDNGDLVLSEVDGDFEDDETLNVGGAPAATLGGLPRQRGGLTVSEDEDLLDLAAKGRRADIEVVPGSGPVRGVWRYRNATYAVRDNAAGTAGVLYHATSSGWTEPTTAVSLAFDAGMTEPAVGDRISVSGGAVGILRAIRHTSGTWAGNDAAGTLYVTVTSGSFDDNDTLRRGASGSEANFATAAGDQAAVTLPAGGSYDWQNHNFGGQTDTLSAFFANGVGRAHKLQAFDDDAGGIVLIPIPTGVAAALDKPTHVAVHHNHLLLAYEASIVGSAPGEPLNYSAADGAFEIATGQKINGMLGGVGLGNTLIMGDDRIQVIYGVDTNDIQLRDQSQDQTGGVANTLQSVGGPMYLDNRGVRSLTTTEAYGNWVIGTLTAAIQPWIDLQRENGNTAIGSVRLRSRDQYRLWWKSGLGVSIYIGGGKPEISLINYGLDGDAADSNPIIPICSVSAEDDERLERVWFGTSHGMVYEAERGRSFDGQPIVAHCRLPLTHLRTPNLRKKFYGFDLHLTVERRATLMGSAVYSNGEVPSSLQHELDNLYGGGGRWDESSWSEFIWNAPMATLASWRLPGLGVNASFLIAHRSAKEAGHVLQGITCHYSPRGNRR